MPSVNTAAYLHWNVDPVAFSIGPVSVRWYGILFATAFLTGLMIMRWIFRTEGKRVEDIDSLFNYMAVGTIVGARLGHVLFYDPVFYFSHPLEILKIWHGGLASHGGAIGILIALWLYTRKRPDQPWLWLLDRVCIPVAIAGSFIRMGNLFNSEILGTRTTVPWAVVFSRVDSVPRHPVMVYEAIAYAIIFVVMLFIYRRYRTRLSDGFLLGLFLVLIFGFRFVVEFVKVRQAAFAGSMILSMGQILSIPLVLFGFWLLVRAGAPHPEATEKEAPPRSTPRRASKKA